MHKDKIQDERLLEISFVDVGQGDGCLIVTPDDKFMLIDAGEGDNMYRFLSWRFGSFRKKVSFQNMIITHPDQDHYLGYRPIIKNDHVSVETLYHNGIVERTGKNRLGPRIKIGTRSYLNGLIETLSDLKKLFAIPSNIGKMRYPNLLKTALDSSRVADIKMLCHEDGFIPGYEDDQALSIQVLGPVTEPGPNGTRALRWLSSTGKTKNGHSVSLKMNYNNISILLGGDLNIPAEEHLMAHYTGLSSRPKSAAEEGTLVRAARQTFECEIAKACHHGSADFTELFLQSVNPIVTVVSSGDNEPHSHPRADALGAFGKYGRGRRPLIFSTELARSAKENIKDPEQLRQKIKDLAAQLDAATTDAKKDVIRKRLDREVRNIERSIAIYGTIHLRSDGTKVIMAQKLEQKRSKAKKWDIHRLEPGPDGELHYVSKH